jgi:hypothetical protein
MDDSPPPDFFTYTTLDQVCELVWNSKKTGTAVPEYRVIPELQQLCVDLYNYNPFKCAESLLFKIILTYCRVKKVRKLTPLTMGVPSPRFPQSVVYTEIQNGDKPAMFGFLNQMISDLGVFGKDLIATPTPQHVLDKVCSKLTRMDLPEYSPVDLRRDALVYQDGVLFCRPDLKFVPWADLKEDVVVPSERALDTAYPGLNPRCPIWESTLTYQFGSDCHQRLWFEASLGRCLLKYHQYDRWKTMPFTTGPTNSGKSPPFRLLTSFFPPCKVKSIAARMEKEFGLQSLEGAWYFTASELPSNPKAECWSDVVASVAKLIQRNEPVSIPRKNLSPWEGILGVTCFFTTNLYRLGWIDCSRLDSNDIFLIESMCCWEFKALSSDIVDPLYEDKLLAERSSVVVRLLQAYSLCVRDYGTQPWQTISATLPSTVKWKTEVLEGSPCSKILGGSLPG